MRKRFDICNFEADKPLPIIINRKVLGMMVDKSILWYYECDIMNEYIRLWPMMYPYLKDDDKVTNSTEMCY